MNRTTTPHRVIAALTAGLLLSGVAAVGARQGATRQDATADAGANASRFLELTGDGHGPSVSVGVDADGDGKEDVTAEVALPSLGVSPELDGVPRAPQGWALRPAGRQVDVLRFPLGLVSTPDERSIVVSSDSGGLQGLTVIDAETLAGIPLPAANLFMGLAVAPDGRIFASGGNADRVFRWQLVGPAAIPLGLTGGQPVPIHNALNGLFGANLGSPTPQSMVADNDVAIGMVDALSHSPFGRAPPCS